MAITNASTHASYDSVAHIYEQGRPDYPQDIVRAFLSYMQYRPGLVICDLGAGTGKLTKTLCTIDPVMNIIAVEPSANMCAVFAKEIPGIPILQASAQKIPLANDSVDIVMVGTAFHWFATKQVLDEIERVLKPGGKLGLIWNIFDTEVDWVREIYNLRNTYRTDQEQTCNHDTRVWMKVFDYADAFSSLEKMTCRYGFVGTEHDVINRVLSSKIISNINSDQRDALLAAIGTVLHKHYDFQKLFNIPYRIEMYWSVKKL